MFQPRRKDEPIITSLMDIDFYKPAMMQVVFLKHPDVPVEYAMTNRTKSVKLAEVLDIGEVREHLDHARSLRFGNSDLHYLRGTNEYESRMFREPFLEALRTYQLPEYELTVGADGQFDWRTQGRWFDTILWETIALSTIAELYCRKQLDEFSRFEQEVMWASGVEALHRKIVDLNSLWEKGYRFTLSDFGTRRRASFAWQDYIVGVLKEELPPEMFRGTSNVCLANKHNLMPMGTNAHEMPMIYSGIFYNEDEENCEKGRLGLPSAEHFLDDWEEVYGSGLTIALPDTYGSHYFFDHIFGEDRLRRWKGSRHDSADPNNYGHEMVARYKKAGVDSTQKMLTWSDSLDPEIIEKIVYSFSDKLKVGFGWGTNLTNDIGMDTLSLVIKAVKANGHGLAKLSDNLDKAVGYDQDCIDRMKRLNSYTEKYHQAPRY